MKFNAFIMVAAAFATNPGDALRCYGCASSNSSDCVEGVTLSYVFHECEEFNSIVPLEDLPLESPIRDDEALPVEAICIRLLYESSLSDVFVSGCSYTFKGIDICKYLKLANVAKECSYCGEDLCNGTPLGPSFWPTGSVHKFNGVSTGPAPTTTQTPFISTTEDSPFSIQSENLPHGARQQAEGDSTNLLYATTVNK